MRYPARFLYFLGISASIYIVLPIVFAIFWVVYLVWTLKPIKKETMNKVTAGWQEVEICKFPSADKYVYPNSWDYLRDRNKNLRN